MKWFWIVVLAPFPLTITYLEKGFSYLAGINVGFYDAVDWWNKWEGKQLAK